MPFNSWNAYMFRESKSITSKSVNPQTQARTNQKQNKQLPYFLETIEHTHTYYTKEIMKHSSSSSRSVLDIDQFIQRNSLEGTGNSRVYFCFEYYTFIAMCILQYPMSYRQINVLTTSKLTDLTAKWIL